jgi:UDP-2,3-diacylglucosamine hydrolase
MKISKISVKKGAVFVADVHYKRGDEEFLEFLRFLLKKPPSQLFLVGDIFHLLLPFNYLIEYNKEAIDLIEKIALKTEVYYTSGNHDFNLKPIFKNVKISDAFVDEEKSIFITHGDLTDKDRFYKLYVFLIRTYLGNKLLNLVSFNFVNNWLFKAILKKNVKCLKIFEFKTKIKSKIADINYKMIIEGHYHQNKSFDFGDKVYVNLGAFACDKSYHVLENEIKGYKWMTKLSKSAQTN